MERLADQGIVIAAKRHGEQRFIVSILTENNGLCSGMFRASKKTKAVCEPGTVVACKWQARLPEHMGTWTLEPVFSTLSAVFANSLALVLLNSACALVKVVLPERDAAKPVYQSLLALLHYLRDDPLSPIECFEGYCFFELFLLAAFAVKLDLSTCAATGSHEDLIYVSPKTGRAVSKEAGLPYHDKMLSLPAFLQQKSVGKSINTPVSWEEILAALRLSGYFLDKYGFMAHDREMPTARHQLVELCRQKCRESHRS